MINSRIKIFTISLFTVIPFLTSCNSSKITITFDPNGGQITSGTAQIKVDKGTMFKNISKPTVNYSGHTYHCWTREKNKESSIVGEQYKFNDNTTLYAYYTEDFTSFEFDTWKNVIDTANRGLQALKNKYNCTSFVGKKRHISVDGYDYQITVVDENHDMLANEYEKGAALTFQFTSEIAVSEAKYHNPNNAYISSYIRSRCKEIYNKIDDNYLKNNIRTVNKKTYQGGGSNYLINDYNEKLYIPSYSELGGDSLTYPIKEEETFQYYKKDPQLSRPITSWTRSPVKDNAVSIFYVDKNGNIAKTSSGYFRMFPCFSIGIDRRSDMSFYNSSWSDIISIAEDGGLEGLKTAYNTNSFIGFTHPIKIKDKIYTAKVVGENEDLLANEGVNNAYGALTFMLVDSIGTFNFSSLDPSLRFNNWSSSTLRNELKNSIQYFDDDVKNHLKEVERISYYGQDGGNKKLDKLYDKLSIPSAIELGFVDGDLQDITHDKGLIKKEGFAYSYFTKTIDTTDLIYRREVHLSEGTEGYFLRSPDYSNFTSVLSLSSELKLESINIREDKTLSVCPIFTIGKSIVDNTSFYYNSQSIKSSYESLGLKIRNSEKYSVRLDIDQYANHCEFPNKFRIVVTTNDGNNFLLDTNDYTFDGISKYLTINSVDSLKSKYPNIKSITLEPEVSIKDSWETIKNNLSAGHLEYYPVGATKELEINSIKYEARIIGKQHDITNNDEYTDLTFMLTSPLKDVTSDYYTNTKFSCKWSVDDSSNDSLLKNNYETNLSAIETAISCSVKQIKKTTGYFDYTDDSQTKTSTYLSSNNKLFALSYSEVFSETYAYRYEYFKTHSTFAFVNNETFNYLFRDTELNLDATIKYTRFTSINNIGKVSYHDINDYQSQIIPNSNLIICFAI